MNNNNIQKKLTSLTLMTIMVAGGMTFAVPGMVPEAYAANANLFVSAENSLFDNYMSGPQVIEVAIIDSSISDTNEGKGEPDVTINGNQLRMVQATDGNWYGYFADYEMARAADDTTPDADGNTIPQGLNFGMISQDGVEPFIEIEADGLFYNEMAKPTNVVREPKSPNDNAPTGLGQIGIDAGDKDKWPFIQLYKLSAGGNVVVQYNKGGGAQSTTLTFDTVDDYAGIELDRASYPRGAEVHATITDAWLNIDPTDEDSWTFNTVNGTAFYHIYNDNGGNGKNTALRSLTNPVTVNSVSVGDLMCSDCALFLEPNVQDADNDVITIQDNADSNIRPGESAAKADAWVDDGDDKIAVKQLDEGTQPVTITEQGPNSGIFGTYDENDDSVLIITDDAKRGTSATLDYNDSPVSVLVTHAFATIDIQPASDVWNSGELIPVVLVDADINKNSRADEDMTLKDPNVPLIPSLSTGSPITLGSGGDGTNATNVYYGDDSEPTPTDVDKFSHRVTLDSDDKVKKVLIDLGITAGDLQGSLLNTEEENVYGYNLFNYGIDSLPTGANVSLVYSDGNITDYGDNKINLVCKVSGNDLKLLGCETPTTPVDTTPIVIPLLYNNGSDYEMQHFGTAFDKAVSDFDAASSKTVSSEKLNLGTNPIQSVLDAGAQGAVGTYTSQQLKDLNDTGKVGTDVGDIVLLSYSSAATSFAEPGDGIFRLTTDTSRQVESVITQLIPANFDNIISIHLNDAWSNDYVDALEEKYGATHETIAYDSSLTGAALTAEFASKFTGLSGLDASTAIVILEYNHDRLDKLITELARTGAYAGISTTKFIIPDVPSGAFGNTISTDALDLLKATDMKTIKFALSNNTAGQTALTTAILNQSPNDEVNPDGNELFDRHAYSAYDAGQILARAIDALGTGYTSAQLNAAIPTAAAAYSSDALIYNTVLNADGDLACMVYDIFEINDSTGGFTLQTPKQATTDASNCPIIGNPVPTPNADPVISSVDGARTVVVDQDRTLTVVATDADNNSLTYSANNTETVSANNDNVFVFTAPTTEGTVAIEFTVTDGNGGTDTEIVTINVHPVPVVNVAPEFTRTSVPTTATVGQTLTFTVEGEDDNLGDTPESLTFEMTAPQGLTSTLTFNTTSGEFSWTPVAADQGRNVFAFAAIDDENMKSDLVLVTITVIAAPTAPGAPTSLTAVPGDTTVALSWTAPSSADATSYKVQQRTGGVAFADSTPATETGTTVTVTGLTNGVSYDFRVIATNSIGDSSASNVVTATPVAPRTAPGAPTSLTAVPGDTTVALSWTASPTATSYKVEQSTDGTTFADSTPATETGTTVTVTGLTNGVQYSFKVTATNSVGDSATASNVVTATPVAAAVNNPPVITSTNPVSGTVGTPLTPVQVMATDVETNDDDLVYNLQQRPAGLTMTQTGLINWPSPTEGTHTVTFTVNDGNANGIASGSITITIVPVPAPTIPDRVNFTAPVNVPILLGTADYERLFGQTFGLITDDGFGFGINDTIQNNTAIHFAPVEVPLTTEPEEDIKMVLMDRDAHGAVGTYTSQQLEILKNTTNYSIGTGTNDIVLLSYASAASSLAQPNDGIFRLTVDVSRQVSELYTTLIPTNDYDRVISIHLNDTWSQDYVKALATTYGNKHTEIAYNGTANNAITDMQNAVNGTFFGDTFDNRDAIVILEYNKDRLEALIAFLAESETQGSYRYAGLENAQFIIPDIPEDTFDDSHADDIALLKATDMKTIKFALNDDATATAIRAEIDALTDGGDEHFDRHAYSAFDAGQILARAIDALGMDYTSATLAATLPDIAEDYSSDALIHNTVLDANGDLQCMVYDIFEIDDTATGFELSDPTQETTDAINCPIPTTQSSTILSNPQTVSCIDCAINSFGEIFGQTVQVHDTKDNPAITHSHSQTVEDIFGINSASSVGLLIEYETPQTIETAPIVLDFFSFGFKNDGTAASDRIHNQIVRLELEETGDNTDTFVGGLEYVMLNQLNILDESTYTGLSPISDEPTFIVMEDLTDEDSPRVNYLDLGADGVSTQIADQQEAPSHSGVVSLDSTSYKVADTVIVTLTDADLNVDSDLIDIFTTVAPENGDMSDTVGDNIMFNDASVSIGSAPLGRVLDITFDDQKWTVNNCTPDDDIDDGLHDTGFTLIETETASGVFTGSFQIPTEYCRTDAKQGTDGKYVRESVTGTDIEVNYVDFRDASGEIIEVGDSAGVRANTGSVSLDRTVYPVPFANNTFSLHASAAGDKSLPQKDVMLHVRISDPDYDISASGEDKIAQDEAPIKVTVSRGQDSKLVYTAGATTADLDRVMEIDGKNRIVPEYGPITEVKGDSGIFEADIPISYKSGPNATATDTACPVYPNQADNIFKDGCVLQGDIITVEYTDPTDASGEPNSVTDSATFDLRNAVLQSDKSVYIIGSDMILTLIEPDFDLDNDGAETYSLDLIEWDSDAATVSMGKLGGEKSNNGNDFDPEPSAFRETGDSTGIFQVVVEIPEALDGDKLERGEEISLEYTDWGPSGSNYVGDEDEDINLTVFTSNFGSTVELDQKVYTWTDKVYITIVAPDHNFDSDLVDEIGNTGDDPIRIATRGADLDQYKLVETGTDTGIFTGEVTLTGFAHDVDGDNKADVTPKTSGNGPTDGFLATEDDDGLSVSFEFSEDETVIGSSLIRWNIGEVQWLEASYAASGTGVVRVIDPDMNLNPESVDNFEVNIWSDSDVGGIDLTVTETNQATGIFEGTTFFTVSDTSSGHRLRVSEGDTVTAEYNDRTLPDPHDTSDEIDITATTQIGSIIPPLERAPATNLRVVDAFSNTLDTIDVDQQVQITADLANGQDKEQPFAYIVQIQDSSSVTVALAWVSGTLTPSQSFSPALSWTPTDAGTYTATAFVWESVDNPTALSPPNELTITVN